MKHLAHSINCEWITDRDGDVCMRPMLFDDEGRRVVRHHPDPCEFVPADEAARRLHIAAREAATKTRSD